jgi:hypothetical protein
MSIIPHVVFYRRPQQSQVERYFTNFFDEAMRELGQLSDSADRMDDRQVNPYYWMGHNLRDSQTLAQAVGNVENTPEKFAVSVNVSQFRPDELKVAFSFLAFLSLTIRTSFIMTDLCFSLTLTFTEMSFVNLFLQNISCFR